ncbi:MAG: S8 family serine peptidase, partial [Flavobacteriales bacterium]|nr:S8 family serine peptidase [Flavobacteriales bacterium]
MMLDTDGGVYVAGITYASMGNTDYLVWKLTVGGVPQWYATYDHAGLADAATSLHMTGDGTLMVSGGSANASGTWDYARVYLHPATGDRLNVERVHVPDLIMTQALGHTRNMAGDIFLAGYGEAGGRRIAQLVKIGEDFNMAWSAAYDTEENSTEACSVDGDAYGNAYVCGTLRKQDGSSYIVILKYDPDGSLLWDRFSGAPAPGIAAWGTKAVATNDGGVAVLGTVHDGTSNNYRILKYLQDGQLEWTRDYDKLNGDELAMDMLVDGTSIYASGKSNTPNGNGYTTVKYTSTKLDNGYVYDAESGEPLYVEGQVMVAFHPYDVDSSRVDDKGWQFGTLGDVVVPEVAEAIGQQLGLPPGEGKAIMAYKVYRRLTTADSISISRLGEEVRVPPFWATFLLGVELGEDPAEVIHGLNQLGDALHYAQPNFVYRLLGDPLYPARQQSLTPVAPYANAGINIEPAWAITHGRPEVRVGVVDELVRPDHPDFNIGSTSGSRVVGGHDYQADRSFESYDWEEQPVFRPHGAACAGIIGAIRNNGEGLAGIAGGDAALGEPGCSLVTLGVARDDEFIPAAQIAEAILEGSSSFPGSPERSFGCHVLNNSYGAGGFMNAMRDIELLRSIWQANRNQCVFVVARGNGQPEPIFPASYGPDGAVLSVGASGWDGSLMTVSNGGYNVSAGGGMDLIAPGAQETISSLKNVD